MNVLLVGSGGREHSIAWKLAQSPHLSHLWIAPGNPGTGQCGENVPVAANDIPALVRFASEHSVDLVVIGPEAPLEAGLSDALRSEGIAVFGPSRAAAQIECSKAFAKQFMQRHGIPTARFAVFDSLEPAERYLEEVDTPIVIKASGLAAGKGVILPESRAEAQAALQDLMVRQRFGRAGSQVVIEERLAGEEVSLLAFTDGVSLGIMPPAQDHKRLLEGDRGPNTGGMGAYAPAPVCPPALQGEIARTILQPTVDGLRGEGMPFVGVLYAGVILTRAGPRVLEFNARFGDPETQAILPLLETDLLDVFAACTRGQLAGLEIRWRAGSAVCVVMASAGYPEKTATPAMIFINEALFSDQHSLTPALSGGEKEKESFPSLPGRGVRGEGERKESSTTAPLPALTSTSPLLFHAGTSLKDGALFATGGRVVSVTALGETLPAAVEAAYRALPSIHFDGAQYRKDIAGKALAPQPTAASKGAAYCQSGVDIDAGNRAVGLIRQAVTSTYDRRVLNGIGAFGGLFDAAELQSMRRPVLVASTDGVGTKVKLGAALGRYRGLGMDIVNHCINDVLVQGARPLFFLDYFATSRLQPEIVGEIVSGMGEACRAARCVLIGGETAEMPGVYASGEFDIAGTLVGCVERDRVLPRSGISAGDRLIGMRSTGPHTNGFSLLRKIFAEADLQSNLPELGCSLADALLEPHRSYLDLILPLLEQTPAMVKGLAHLTGGGFIENIPRILPQGLGVRLDLGSWPVPPLFRMAQQRGGIDETEMYRVFNMGIGMVIVASPEDAIRLQALLPEPTWVIGEIVEDADHRVRLA